MKTLVMAIWIGLLQRICIWEPLYTQSRGRSSTVIVSMDTNELGSDA